MPDFLVAALYKFVRLENYRALREPLRALCEVHGIKGTLLLAREGINGTIAGEPRALHAVLNQLRTDPRLADLEHKESTAIEMPFYRLKVKLKREIVTMGVADMDPVSMAGTYVQPEDWNALIDDPDVVVVDVRNDYEVGIGSFDSAINPHTAHFADFPEWVREQSREGGVLHGKPRVAMFCTGGIRCEKSTSYLRSQGFGEVYHLKGGILKYLESVPEAQSRWHGECFVFDERVSVGHGLVLGAHTFCRACRMPLSAEDRASSLYVEGVSCPHCHAQHSEDKRQRLAQRQRQVLLAQQRHSRHIGVSQDAGTQCAEASHSEAS